MREGTLVHLGHVVLDEIPGAPLDEYGPGRDAVYADAFRGQRLAQLLGVDDQSALDGVVGLGTHERLHPGGAGDDHDGCRVGLLQERHGGLDTAGGAQQVDVEVVLPALFTHVAAAGADIGHEDVDTAQFLCSARYPALVGFLVGHVDRRAGDFHAGGRQLAHRAVHFLLVAGADREVHALAGQQVGDRPADAAG